jgi:NAD(P)-dependent dehydrogenase (short-subunit alcohol dehydrogenase family)
MKAGEKIIVITGANTGIGFAAACALAREGARIMLVCRVPDKGEAALAAVGRIAPSAPSLFIADLAVHPFGLYLESYTSNCRALTS